MSRTAAFVACFAASLGIAAPVSLTPAWSLQGEQPQEQFGFVLREVGDVDGDGLADVAVGAPAHRPSASTQGRAVVLAGASTLRPLRTFTGFKQHSFGFAGLVGGVDFTNDGQPDFVGSAPTEALGVISAPWLDPGGEPQTYVGEIFTLASARDGGVAIDQLQTGTVNHGDFGRSLVWIGGPRQLYLATRPEFRGGTAFIFSALTGERVAEIERHALDAAQLPERKGYFAFGVGDLSGDGVTDVALSAPVQDPMTKNPTGQHPGRVYFYDGTNGRLINVLEGEANSNLGIAVARIGDVNHDGVNELLVGAPGRSGYRGAAYLIDGTAIVAGAAPRVVTIPPGAGAPVLMRWNGTAVSELVGQSVVGIGDDFFAISHNGIDGFTGKVIVYRLDGSVFGEARGRARNEFFGGWLASPNPRQLVVGSPYAGASGTTFRGRVDFFELPADPPIDAGVSVPEDAGVLLVAIDAGEVEGRSPKPPGCASVVAAPVAVLAVLMTLLRRRR